MKRPFFTIPYYHDYLSPSLANFLLSQAQPVAGMTDLVEVGSGGGLETPNALQFLTKLYEMIESDLAKVLAQRIQDRKFIDERMQACHQFNKNLNRDWLSSDYQTILGLEDAKGRIVIGPRTTNYAKKAGQPVATLPDFLKGPHITLFGPPDSAKMAINAMNAFHRKLPTEPAIVAELLQDKTSPMWGADDEDSKTPLRADLVDAAINLTECFKGTLSVTEGTKHYTLAQHHLALPIKRFPGLALPSTFLFYKRNPIPLHLYDFALHLFHNWDNPRALVFYVPKLENEEEAAYIHKMIESAERMIQAAHPSYELGTVRLMIVLENPRAILRAHEIMDALYPYFAGASLGWHDYLASTARIFKNESNYRIPVKADPDIVIKYIKASHLLLAEAVGSRGGIKVGGMYGILPLAGNENSLQVTLKGFIKDVVTQMKRDLTGFWVAHPDFVRLGLALVEAWKRRIAGDHLPLETLVRSLLHKQYHQEILDFINGPDIEGLDLNNPNYVRSLIVADIKESDYIANNHPEEIRYNVFQSLQYLTDWLCGNGCVALPTIINGTAVRVMDDLATAERSRWEVWHELHHGRFSMEDFIKIVHEEMNFIRRDLSNDKKIVQVKWDERTAKWYPVALKLMLQLMTAKSPVEFATELLIPFTIDAVRNSKDPWAAVQKIDGENFSLDEYVARFNHYFEICGVERFASSMAQNAVEDHTRAEEIIKNFSVDEIITAASFHGDIGQSKTSLDARASDEQALVLGGAQNTQKSLRDLGEIYRTKFGFKFLISAKGKTADELLSALKERLNNSATQETANARLALWEISHKRLQESSLNRTKEKIETLRKKYGIAGASIAINYHGHTQALCFGEASKGKESVRENTLFEIASLSKTIATAFAVEYFRTHKIPLSTFVNELFAKTNSDFRIQSSKNPAWASKVTLEHLMSHSALNMHYVKGFSPSQTMPKVRDLLEGKHGYEAVDVIAEPGKEFHYSGAGFLVLEHLLEELHAIEGKKSLNESISEYLRRMNLSEIHFGFTPTNCAHGYLDDGSEVPGTRYHFPSFAAGAFGSARDVAKFLAQLSSAYTSVESQAKISHDTAVEMLHGSDKGCKAFMGCDMGLGVFTAEAGENKFALHQGANEGFRAIYLECYDGPDKGKGLVIFCNGDNRSILFIAETVQEILSALKMQGIDFSRLEKTFSYETLPQEQIVNLGYKNLIFDAFVPNLPEEIPNKGPLDPLSAYNLAVGAKILAVTNQRFARAENLVSPHIPVFDPELFGKQGKMMDSWESARHNQNESDSLILALPQAASFQFISFSTKFHDGNQAEFVKLYGFNGNSWSEIIPKTPMAGHSLLQIDLGSPTQEFSQVRVEIFPDGGLSRLGLFRELPEAEKDNFKSPKNAKCVRFTDPIPKTQKPLVIPYKGSPEEWKNNLSRAAKIDYASLAFGGEMLKATNEHYGPAVQVISPYPPIHMFDGLESARSREAGHHEEVLLKLAKRTSIENILLDFTFFVNNNPLFVSVHGFDGKEWIELVPKTKVKAFAGNTKLFSLTHKGMIEQVLVKTYPDGGINRIKVFSE